MERTRESTLFEAICGVIGILALILAFKIGDKEVMITLLTACVGLAVSIGMCLGLAYFPDSDWISIPVKRDPDNLPQMVMMSRLLRIIALELALLMLGTMADAVVGGKRLTDTLTTGMLIVILATTAYFIVRLRKLGKTKR